MSTSLFSRQNPRRPRAEDRPTKELRADVKAEFQKLAPIAVEEYTNPVAADADGILLAKACTVATQSYAAADLDGVVGSGTLTYGRNITVTTAGNTPADAPATCTVTGTYRGAVQTEAISVAQTATVATGTKCFDTVTSIELTAGQGTDATVSVGFGSKLGTRAVPKVRAALAMLIAENAAGSKVTTGAIDAQGYTPAAVPDAAKDYVIFFEFDAALAVAT